MTTFEDTIYKAKEVIDMAGKKTGELVNIQKLKVNIAGLNSQMANDFEAIGRLCYDNMRSGTDNGDAIAAIAEEIDEKQEQVRQLRERIAELKGERICGGCNNPVSNDAEYCPKCGAKL
ncbi:MAG: hypothetical protein PUB05_01095 [Firmicutes bacterium]|nr:hypothetical protein [Bacillota bacterium]